MKKIFLLIILVMVFTLSGCNSKGYKDPVETVQNFLNLYTDAAEGKDINAEEECALVAKGDYIDECIRLIEENESDATEFGAAYSFSIAITDSELRELSKEERNALEFDDYDQVFELYIDYLSERTFEEGGNVETEEDGIEFYLVEEDGRYYIIYLG